MELVSRKLAPVHLACGNDYLRENMHYVYVTNGWAFATDAHIMAATPILDIVGIENSDLLEGKVIHKSVWNKMCSLKLYGLEVDSEYITTVDGPVVTKYSLKSTINYPDILNIFSYIKDFDEQSEDNVSYVSFDVRLLSRLTKAMGVPTGATLKFTGKNDKILVTCNIGFSIGILMPIMSDLKDCITSFNNFKKDNKL